MGRRDVQLCNRLLNIVKEEGDIHAFDLVDKAHISLSQYNNIKAYFERKYEGWVRYDKPSKTWTLVHQELKQEQKEELK